ncbi:MAG: aromatic-ring-hydroxylating dioxygenase subunit beta [Panacagrimonas sp.]
MAETKTAVRAAAKVSEAVHSEAAAFLYLEARLLGTAQERVWLNEMVHPEIAYRVSSRQLRSSKDRRYAQPNEVFHFDDDYSALDRRVAQPESGLQWRSDPPETLIYYVSNIEVFEDEKPGDLRVYSNVLMIRDRRVYESDQFHYRRDDVLRRGDDGALRLYSRNVVYGQRFVQGKNLLFFL